MNNIKITMLVTAFLTSMLAPLPEGGLEVYRCDEYTPLILGAPPALFTSTPYQDRVRGIFSPYSCSVRLTKRSILEEGLDEAGLQQLQSTGVTPGGSFTLVSPEEIDISSVEILPHMIEDSDMATHKIVLAYEIVSGRFAGKYMVAFGRESAIFKKSELDELKNLQTVKGYTLDPEARVFDVYVLNERDERVLTLKLPRQLTMIELFYKIELFANLSLQKNPELENYSVLEIGGVPYSSGRTQVFKFKDGDVIKIFNTGNPIQAVNFITPDGWYASALVPKLFTTREIFQKTMEGIPHADLLTFSVDGFEFFSCYRDDASDDIWELPPGTMLIQAQPCDRVYCIDPETGNVNVFYRKFSQDDIKVYKETPDGHVFVESHKERNNCERIGIPPQGFGPKTDDAVDHIVNSKYIFCKPEDLENIEQIGTINEKPVRLIYNKSGRAVIQTHEGLIILDAKQLDDLLQGKKVTRKMTFADGTPCVQEAQLDVQPR